MIPSSKTPVATNAVNSAGASAARALRDVVTRWVELFRPESIVLFGSRAWGRPREDSDWDLMVIVADSSMTPIQRAISAHRAVADLGIPVDILVRTRPEFERFQNVSAAIEHEIAERGVVVYG